MARKSQERQAVIDADLDHGALQTASDALGALTEGVRELMSTYELASAHPDVLCSEIQAYQASAVESMFQIGVRLMLLHQVVPHGEWTKRLTSVGMQPRTAQRIVQATMKYSDPKRARSERLLGLGKGKLLELLVLDDEQLDVLDAGGEIGELDLDDIAKMSPTELRGALREARATVEAKDALIVSKDEKLNDLDIKLREARKFKPSADAEARTLAEQKQLDEIATAVREVEVGMARLMVVVAEVMHEGTNEALRGRAMQALQYVSKRLTESAEEQGFDLNGGGEGVPAWLQD